MYRTRKRRHCRVTINWYADHLAARRFPCHFRRCRGAIVRRDLACAQHPRAACIAARWSQADPSRTGTKRMAPARAPGRTANRLAQLLPRHRSLWPPILKQRSFLEISESLLASARRYAYQDSNNSHATAANVFIRRVAWRFMFDVAIFSAGRE